MQLLGSSATSCEWNNDGLGEGTGAEGGETGRALHLPILNSMLESMIRSLSSLAWQNSIDLRMPLLGLLGLCLWKGDEETSPSKETSGCFPVPSEYRGSCFTPLLLQALGSSRLGC